MRQVPQETPHGRTPPPCSFLIVGNGRVARHFLHYFQALSIPTTHWPHARQITPAIIPLLTNTTHVWVLVSDQAISEITSTLRTYASGLAATEIHFLHASGAFHHPEIHTIHPLCTFGTELYDCETYQKFYFTTSTALDSPVLLPLLSALPNSFQFLKPENLPTYHAYCVMAANFPQILWSQLQSQFQNLSLQPDSLLPLIEHASENWLKHQAKALTGPLVRNDQQTIARNKEGLGQSPELLSLYYAFEHLYSYSSKQKRAL